MECIHIYVYEELHTYESNLRYNTMTLVQEYMLVLCNTFNIPTWKAVDIAAIPFSYVIHQHTHQHIHIGYPEGYSLT